MKPTTWRRLLFILASAGIFALAIYYALFAAAAPAPAQERAPDAYPAASTAIQPGTAIWQIGTGPVKITLSQGRAATDSHTIHVPELPGCEGATGYGGEQVWASWFQGWFRLDGGAPNNISRDHEVSFICDSSYVDCEQYAAAAKCGTVTVAWTPIYAACRVQHHASTFSWPIIRTVVSMWEQGHDGGWSEILFNGESACALNVSGGCRGVNKLQQLTVEPMLWEQAPLTEIECHGGEPPPTPAAGPIGYIGGSLSRNAVAGRNALPGSEWWPFIEKYGGMHIELWGAPDEHRKWQLFRDEQAKAPAKTIWLDILVRPGRDQPALSASDVADLERTIARIKQYAPTAEAIVASGMPEGWWEGCPVNQAAIDASEAMVKWGIEQGHWTRGPRLAFITEEMSNGPRDPCHQGPEGMRIHGEALREIQ